MNNKNYNVLYIHTHDSGNYFGPYGFNLNTINLDNFAKDAIVFEDAYCSSPTCSPSRSALLTGKYPHNNGMLGLANRGFCLNNYEDHIVNTLNKNGYDTILCGIQHEYGRYTEHEIASKKIGYKYDISSSCSGLKEKEFVNWDKENTNNLCNWLSENKDNNKPFFISMGFFSTHRQYPDVENNEFENIELPSFLENTDTIKEDWLGHLKTLKLFDINFGKIIESLKSNNLYDKTIILFTTDHGIAYPNAKCTLYDNGIKVAMIIRVPNSNNNGNKYKYSVSHVDIIPTLISLLNIKTNNTYEGFDFSNIFYDDINKQIRDKIFAEVNFHTSFEPMRCIKKNGYKLIHYLDLNNPFVHLSNIDNSPTKDYYIENNLLNNKKSEWELYDTNNDCLEKNNLAYDDNYKEVLDELKKELREWQIKTDDFILKQDEFKWDKNWIVNKPTCIDPKSKDKNDFIDN